MWFRCWVSGRRGPGRGRAGRGDGRPGPGRGGARRGRHGRGSATRTVRSWSPSPWVCVFHGRLGAGTLGSAVSGGGGAGLARGTNRSAVAATTPARGGP